MCCSHTGLWHCFMLKLLGWCSSKTSCLNHPNLHTPETYFSTSSPPDPKTWSLWAHSDCTYCGTYNPTGGNHPHHSTLQATVLTSLLHGQVVQAALPQPAEGPFHSIQPGDFVVMKDLCRKSWKALRWPCPFHVLLVTHTTVKVAEWVTWIHASHCRKVPAPPDLTPFLLQRKAITNELNATHLARGWRREECQHCYYRV